MNVCCILFRSPRAIIVLSILVLIMLFVVIPTFFRYNKTIQRHMIFLPWGKTDCSLVNSNENP